MIYVKFYLNFSCVYVFIFSHQIYTNIFNGKRKKETASYFSMHYHSIISRKESLPFRFTYNLSGTLFYHQPIITRHVILNSKNLHLALSH